MDDPHHVDKRPPIPGPGSLKSAIRKARIESAERSDVVSDLRGAELARLELLQDAISGVLAEVPEGVDMFDAGLVPGDHPRLFIDMLAFVEMARDRRTYRFLQDTRYGRLTLIESDHLGPLVEAVTNYVARRLIEREKALASDQTLPPPAPARPAPVTPAAAPAPFVDTAGAADPSPAEPPVRQGQIRIRRPDTWQSQAWPPEPPRRGSSLLRGLFNTLALVVLVLLVGAAVYFTAQEWTRPY